jgi:hypothetical protein
VARVKESGVMTTKLPGPEVLEELYKNGTPLNVIAKTYGVSNAYVSDTFKRHGISKARTCLKCETEFEARKYSINFCSSYCRSAYYRQPFDAEKNKLSEPSVYAVYFRSVGLLKVGYATQKHYLGAARAKGREVFGADDGERIWLRPGDYRHESYIQSVLAFRYPQPNHENRRICEWFRVGDMEISRLAAELDRILTMANELAREAA